MSTGILLNGIEVQAGSSTSLGLYMGRLPSGAKISVKTYVYAGEQEGPTALLLAGLHGDEINGVEILRRAMDKGLFDNILRGNIIVIPILNIYGFINFSREVPDGKDVNRSFPGTMTGSLASRVARILTKRVLPLVDFGVDFHTGGDNRFNYPQIRYSRKDVEAQVLAEAFATPYLLEKGLISKSLRKVAKDMDVPMLVFEGGEALRLDGFVIESALKGIERLLANKGLIESNLPTAPSLVFRKSSWIRATDAGIFIWSKKSGTKISKGEVLGSILDPSGQVRVAVTASRDGYILGHNNTPVVHQGDALFHVGYDVKSIEQ
ncbi:MAG: succinylglutamate desuccinylase/aspartoacylase family protein [Saprospiraceae bacterium]|nr:succinylglutamate desuccinylase/aspartoacylase family protein [Saprospiraceae bacterium]